MPALRSCAAWIRRPLVATVLMLLVCAAAQADVPEVDPVKLRADIPTLPTVFDKDLPENLNELKAIEKHVQAVLKKVMPAVVGVRIGSGQGSGVIISEDGYILTAAHVSGPPGRTVQIIFPDGRKVRGKTLGMNTAVDAGLIKIDGNSKWPFVPMGHSEDIHRGTWCVAVGHPGGFQSGRTPVVRVGRVLNNLRGMMQTDCALVGGDSGGPLFDMEGRVIGIHSRIGGSITYNIHVPVDNYRRDWDRMVASAVFPGEKRAYLGVQGDPDGDICRIVEVVADTPAAQAGIKEGDIILRFNKEKVGNFDDLVHLVGWCQPGQRVEVELRRGENILTLNLTLGHRER